MIIAVVVTVVVTLVTACVVFIVVAVICNEKDERKKKRKAAHEKESLLLSKLADICGLAILGQEVFISRVKRQYIEVYDSTTFQFKRRMAVDGMTDPEHIVSCTINNCLYAVDWCYQDQDPTILRINPADGSLNTTWNVYGTGGLLSVASDTNVILNVNFEDKLREYTADGQLIREINLGLGIGITKSCPAVKLNGGLFVVCHGANDDPVDRVSLLSIKATTGTVDRINEVEIRASYGAEQGKQINRMIRPMYLSVNKEGLILVSDELNKEAVLLSSDLKELEILVSEEEEMGLLRRMCFDESTGRWIMVDRHRVMVCRVKSEGGNRKCYDLIIG